MRRTSIFGALAALLSVFGCSGDGPDPIILEPTRGPLPNELEMIDPVIPTRGGQPPGGSNTAAGALNNPDKLFVSTGQIFGASSSSVIVLADLDLDGDLDIAVSDAEGVHTWAGDGKGFFTPLQDDLSIPSASTLAVGDLDGDAIPDIFAGILDGPTVVGLRAAPDRVLFGDGTGMLIDSAFRLGQNYTRVARLLDYDRDGDLDVLVGTQEQNLLRINDGNGNLTTSLALSGTSRTSSIAIGDLNLDGLNDHIDGSDKIIFGGAGLTGEPDRVYFRTGENLNAFVRTTGIGTAETKALALGDVDGDLDMDLIVGAVRSNLLWLNDGSGNFSFSGVILSDLPTLSMAMRDIDLDGALDVIEGHEGGTIIHLGDGKGRFEIKSQSFGGRPRSIALGDLDGDGALDLVTAGTSGIQVWHNRIFSLAGLQCEGRIAWKLNETMSMSEDPETTFGSYSANTLILEAEVREDLLVQRLRIVIRGVDGRGTYRPAPGDVTLQVEDLGVPSEFDNADSSFEVRIDELGSRGIIGAFQGELGLMGDPAQVVSIDEGTFDLNSCEH